MGSNLLRSADILVFAVGGSAGQLDEWQRALALLPNANVSMVHEMNNPGKQGGAKLAMETALVAHWFDQYEWVIRLNPDVLLLNTSLLDASMKNTTAEAILADCTVQMVTPTVMTDFFAMRPGAIAEDSFSTSTPSNSEAAATAAFDRVINKGKVIWLDPQLPGPMCRIHRQDILHWHGAGCPGLPANTF